ncbi:MAG: class I SAM-dependent methyltransferase, partial [Candidatus Heimdallarchaeota archaeon]
FMQSRKVSKLIVIDRDSTPVFEFQFEDEDEETFDDELLKEAFTAIGSIMNRGGSAGSNLTTINFNELEIMTEIREDFSALLIVDRQTAYLKEGLEAFADDFVKIYPKNAELNEIRTQKLKYTAEKMIQKNFGLEQEEFDQIKEIVSLGYDKMADKYLKTRSEDVPEVKLLPDFMKRLPVGARVLDAGCGAGEPITRLLSEKFKVSGVDISKKQIDIAREMLPYCEFIWQDMTTLTFPDEYFDGIVSYYAIPHVPREEHMGLLENFYRMLKPNGIVLICFGTSDEPGVVVDDFLGVKMYWSSFDAGTNIEMLKEVGYHVLWLKLIFDDVTDEQHIFILAQKLVTDFVDEIEELEDIE